MDILEAQGKLASREEAENGFFFMGNGKKEAATVGRRKNRCASSRRRVSRDYSFSVQFRRDCY